MTVPLWFTFAKDLPVQDDSLSLQALHSHPTSTSWNTGAVDNQNNLLIFVNGRFVCYKEIVTHLAQSLENLWVL